MERENWDEPIRYQNGKGEAEVVPTFQLAEQIEIFLTKWRGERPQYDSLEPHSKNDYAYMGALDWLEEETTRLGHRVGVRYIARVRTGEINTVPFSKAEILLMAMDRDYMLKNDEIQVVPNPNWSLTKWIEYMSQRGCI